MTLNQLWSDNFNDSLKNSQQSDNIILKTSDNNNGHTCSKAALSRQSKYFSELFSSHDNDNENRNNAIILKDITDQGLRWYIGFCQYAMISDINEENLADVLGVLHKCASLHEFNAVMELYHRQFEQQDTPFDFIAFVQMIQRLYESYLGKAVEYYIEHIFSHQQPHYLINDLLHPIFMDLPPTLVNQILFGPVDFKSIMKMQDLVYWLMCYCHQKCKQGIDIDMDNNNNDNEVKIEQNGTNQEWLAIFKKNFMDHVDLSQIDSTLLKVFHEAWDPNDLQFLTNILMQKINSS